MSPRYLAAGVVHVLRLGALVVECPPVGAAPSLASLPLVHPAKPCAEARIEARGGRAEAKAKPSPPPMIFADKWGSIVFNSGSNVNSPGRESRGHTSREDRALY